MPDDDRTDRILREIQGVRDELRKLNGKVARHDQTLYGATHRGGLDDDVRNLFKILEKFSPGMTKTSTIWAAVSALAAIAAVTVALVIGMS